jgi:hypothetical protein
MTVTLRKPTSPEYKNFSSEVKRRAKSRYENFTYGEEEVSKLNGCCMRKMFRCIQDITVSASRHIGISLNDDVTLGNTILRDKHIPKNRFYKKIFDWLSVYDDVSRN